MENVLKDSRGTRYIILINIIIHIFSIFGLLTPTVLGINAIAIINKGQWYRLIGNMFSHFNIMHLLCNMYAFFSFGILIEKLLGTKKFITFYISSGVLCSIMVLAIDYIFKLNILAAGASGAIFSLMGYLLIISNRLHGLGRTIARNVVITLIISSLAGGSLICHIAGLISGIIVANTMCKYKNNDKNKFNP